MKMKQFDSFDDFKKAMDDYTDPNWDKIEYYSTFINAAIDARLKKGWTQERLAKKSGLKQSAIARFESYDCEPRLSTIRKVFEVLGLKIEIVPTVNDVKIIPIEKAKYRMPTAKKKRNQNTIIIYNENKDVELCGGTY